MHFVLPGIPTKKRDWVIASALSFVLSLAFYLFDQHSFSAVTQPVFWKLAVSCAVFSCAVSLTFLSKNRWIPLAALAAGTIGTATAAPDTVTLLLFVLLPAALLCWLFRFFSPYEAKGSQNLIPWVTFCILLFAGDVYLTLRITDINPADIGSVVDFFRSSQNRQLWCFFVLFAMLLANVLLCFVPLRLNDPEKDSKKKKQTDKSKKRNMHPGKKSTGRKFPVKLLCIPILFFYISILFCCIVSWKRADELLSFPLLSALPCLFVLLSMRAESY